MTKYLTATLENGMRIIYMPSDSEVVYCGIGMQAGARQDAEGQEGLAHFCEHLSFKGTQRHSAMQILNGLERVGGDLNAFTNKEDTVFYATVMREHLARAVDLLFDIVFFSQYPEKEIHREAEVVCDEIESYNDSPAELIYDEFENRVFQGHPLGHNILGSRQRVLSFTSQDARQFTRRYYRPDHAVFFVYGKVDFHRLLKSIPVVPITESAPLPEHTSTKEQPAPAPSGEKGSGNLSHVMMGARTFGFDDARRMPLYVLNNILGGPGMNARLNLTLREHYGLVYTVESALSSYSDTGCWSVYFGCDHDDVKRCMQLVRRELDRVMQKPFSDRQLAAAKRQLKGQLLIACDNREQFAIDFGRHFLHYGRERHVSELLQRIDDVTAAQMQDVAQAIFTPEHIQTLIL